MYVIFNKDGSIKDQNITEFIQQGNNGVNSIKVAIVDKNPSAYIVEVSCKLPNDDVVDFSSFDRVDFIDKNGNEYSGYAFSLNDLATSLAGIVRVNIVAIEEASNKKLVTYSLYLSVNEGTSNQVAAIISEQEYQNLLSIIGQAANSIHIYALESTETIEEFIDTYSLQNNQPILIRQNFGSYSTNHLGFIRKTNSVYHTYFTDLSNLDIYKATNQSGDTVLAQLLLNDYRFRPVFDGQIENDISNPSEATILSTLGLVDLFNPTDFTIE